MPQQLIFNLEIIFQLSWQVRQMFYNQNLPDVYLIKIRSHLQ